MNCNLLVDFLIIFHNLAAAQDLCCSLIKDAAVIKEQQEGTTCVLFLELLELVGALIRPTVLFFPYCMYCCLR